MGRKTMDLGEVKAKLRAEATRPKASYGYVGVTMPNELLAKIDLMTKRYDINRSKLMQLLVDHADAENFLQQLGILE